MAKKKNEKVVLENVELRPQVIGYIYQKKNNVGRVVLILVAFALAIYYINDISIFINNLLGKQTANTIKDDGGKKPNLPQTNPDGNDKEIVYNVFSTSLVINESGLVLNNFSNVNNTLTFDANNNNTASINLSNRKFFLETYSEEKKLLERHKIDFASISPSNKMSLSFTLNNPFYYLVITEKTIDDYPIITLDDKDTGSATITCTKDIENIVYTFVNNELTNIKHTINDSNVSGSDYYNNYAAYQTKVATYNNIDGITATFNGTTNGYTAIIDVDLATAKLDTINERYYYKYKEQPKVVNFEMQTYGFNCK